MVITFDPPATPAPGFESTLAMFTRHYDDAIAEGLTPAKAETEAAIRTVQERAAEVADLMHRRQS